MMLLQSTLQSRPVCSAKRTKLPVARHSTRRNAGIVRAAPDVETSEAQKAQVGFRWDGTLQRWVKDKRVNSQVWNNVPMMETRTGGNYVIWPVVHTALVDAGLKSVNAEEAKKLAAKGAVFVDIRTAANFEKEHLPDAVNVPLFVPVAGQEAFDKIKRFVMATAFAMTATERNKRFAEDAQAALKPGQQVIVYCSRGGTLTTGVVGRRGKFDDPDRSFGIESRSLKGCYELMQVGFKNVVHLEGGMSTWRHSGNPTEP